MHTYVHTCIHTYNCYILVRKLESKPQLIWLDKFSKLYNTSRPGLSGGARSDCLWTGVALVQHEGLPNLSMDVVHLDDGSVMSAMPPRICTSYFNEHVKSLLITVDASSWYHLDSSIVSQYSVNNVPCKPVPDMIREPGLHALLSKSPDGLQNWYPKQMLSRNIGTNNGLLKILRDIVVDLEVDETPKYRVILADINIFWRGLKVHVHHLCSYLFMPIIQNVRLSHVLPFSVMHHK